LFFTLKIHQIKLPTRIPVEPKKYSSISIWPMYIDKQNRLISLIEAAEIKKAKILEGISQQENPIVIKLKL